MQTDEKESLREFWKGTIQANKCGLYCFSEASKAEEACELFRENIPAGWWCSVIREKELNVYKTGTIEQFESQEAENIEKARRERAIRDRELFGGRARRYQYWRNSKKRSSQSRNRYSALQARLNQADMRDRYRAAQQASADALAEKSQELAERMIPKEGEEINPHTAKVVLEHLRWLSKVKDPARYGDTQNVNMNTRDLTKEHLEELRKINTKIINP